MAIPFNKPYFSGNELSYMKQAIESGKISGDGTYTRLCQAFFEKRYNVPRVLLTSSCTDALEMAALLCRIEPGDEVIMPAYTFVSTANAFVLRGAIIRFVDCSPDHPNMDVSLLEKLITPKTRAIVCMHYGGMACDMTQLKTLCDSHKLYLIEDAAQAIESSFHGKPLGSFGHLATFSFHETKNIISGEGGMLVINDDKLIARAEILREKGTNRTAFFRGEVDKYTWVDLGSSYLPSELTAAYLWAQLECMDRIQQKRIRIWNRYMESLAGLKADVMLPVVPEGATNNGHLFYLVCKNMEERDALIAALRKKEIHAVFHYMALHKSPYYMARHDGRELPHCDYFSNGLVRLPVFYELEEDQQNKIMKEVLSFYRP